MTKWSRIRRRKERRRAEAEERLRADDLQNIEPQIEDSNTQQEKKSKNLQQPRENEGQKNTQAFKQKSILSHIPRYVYVVVFFVFLSGVFFPFITADPDEQNLTTFFSGIAILFLGLTGAILVYTGTMASKNQAVTVSFGFVLIAISLALMFTIAGIP